MINFQGESFLSRIRGFSAIGLSAIFGFSLSLKLDPIGLILSLGFIGLALFLSSRMIEKVSFNDNTVTISYFLFRKAKLIYYQEIKKLYKNQEGFLPVYVYVVKCSENSSLSKFTFYGSDDRVENLIRILENKGLSKKIDYSSFAK